MLSAGWSFQNKSHALQTGPGIEAEVERHHIPELTQNVPILCFYSTTALHFLWNSSTQRPGDSWWIRLKQLSAKFMPVTVAIGNEPIGESLLHPKIRAIAAIDTAR